MPGTCIKPLALVVAVCASGSVLPGTPAGVAANREAATVLPCNTISPRQEAAILSAGASVLRHVAQARADVGTRDAADAAAEIDRTEALLASIQATLPTTDAREWIQVAQKHLEYASPREVLPDLIPVYASLAELHESMPTAAAKQHLDQARESLRAGDGKQAREALEATARAVRYIEVELPLDSTRQLIARARTDLNGQAWDAADRALQSAEDSTVYLSVAYEQPLFAAKALLWQTVLDLDAGDNDLARSDFEGAIGYLELASQTASKSTRKAAGLIYTQAKDLQKDLDGGADAGSGVWRLWEQTRALVERSLEYLAAGWERYHTGDRLKSSLIEARLHLANARIDLFTGNETRQAGEELQAALRFLDQAAGQTDTGKVQDSYQRQIADLQVQVQRLRSDPAAAPESRYAVLQRTLQNMIRSL